MENTEQKKFIIRDLSKKVYKWNQTDCDYSKNKEIHQLFEDQAKKYYELNIKTNSLKHSNILYENKCLNIPQFNLYNFRA